MDTVIKTTAKVTHAWHVADTHTAAEIADVVLVARVTGYVRNLERAAFRDEMRMHMSECRARYITAWDMDLWLGQAQAFGEKWAWKR